MDVEQAREIVRRCHEIREGHIWQPGGWTAWDLRFYAARPSADKITVFLSCLEGRFRGAPYMVAYRVGGNNLDEALRCGLANLQFDDYRKEQLERDPFEKLPDDLVRRLLKDLMSPAPRLFEKASFILAAAEGALHI